MSDKLDKTLEHLNRIPPLLENHLEKVASTLDTLIKLIEQLCDAFEKRLKDDDAMS